MFPESHCAIILFDGYRRPHRLVPSLCGYTLYGGLSVISGGTKTASDAVSIGVLGYFDG